MKMTHASLILVLLLSNCLSSFAQENHVKDGRTYFLKTGDRIPDLKFAVSNYKMKEISLTDFKGRLTILDFWGTYCGSCIEAMPLIEQLQRQFKDSIRVIMVTGNSDEEVRKCAIRSLNVRNNHLPFINGKENLAGYFNLSFVPQYAWIDSKGIIRYIGTESDLTAGNIRAFFGGKVLTAKEKIVIPDLKENEPQMVRMYPFLGNNFDIYSYLAPIDYGSYEVTSSQTGLDKFNRSASGVFNFKDLYRMAYGFADDQLSNDRIIIHFTDTAKYADPVKAYVYDIYVKNKASINRVRKYMQSEFDLFFNVNSTIEKRLIPCLVFKQIENEHSCYTAKNDTNFYDRVADTLKITMRLGQFFEMINKTDFGFIAPYTIVDETGIDPKRIVEFKMATNFADMDEVKRSLFRFGLTVEKEDRQMDCIVLSDVR